MVSVKTSGLTFPSSTSCNRDEGFEEEEEEEEEEEIKEEEEEEEDKKDWIENMKKVNKS